MIIHISERFPELTRRQREICVMLAFGHTNKEIGAKIGISHRTVEDHRRDIFERLNVTNAAAMVHKIYGEQTVVA